MAPPPTQPLSKLDSAARSPAAAGGPAATGARRSTAADLLNEKFAVKVRVLLRLFQALVDAPFGSRMCAVHQTHMGDRGCAQRASLQRTLSLMCRCRPSWRFPSFMQAVQESENDKAEIVIVCEPEGMSLQARRTGMLWLAACKRIASILLLLLLLLRHLFTSRGNCEPVVPHVKNAAHCCPADGRFAPPRLAVRKTGQPGGSQAGAV